MTTANTNLFAPKGNRKTTPVVAGDPWADTPFLSPGLTTERVQEMTEEGKEVHKAAWNPGEKIAGIFNGLMTKKNPPAKGAKVYGRFTSVDGQKFRVDAPGQLAYLLESLVTDQKIGRYVELTYAGKEYVEKLQQDCHQFELSVEEAIN